MSMGVRSGVRLLAFDLNFVAAHMLNARHDADGLGLLFQHRTLLDVCFKGCLDGLARPHALACRNPARCELAAAR